MAVILCLLNLIKNLGLYFLCFNLFYFPLPFSIDLFLVYFVNVPGLNGKKQTIKINWSTSIQRNSTLSHAGACFFPKLMQGCSSRSPKWGVVQRPCVSQCSPSARATHFQGTRNPAASEGGAAIHSLPPSPFQSYSPTVLQLGQERMFL